MFDLLSDWFFNIPRQYRTHKRADLSQDAYVAFYKKKLEKVRIGTSFSPELVEQMYERENKRYLKTPHEALQILDILVKQLLITDIRLGIRWNRAVDKKGNADLSYYKPFLDYCIKNKVRICLNVGPIKTFGWPEEHIPQIVLENTPLPAKGAVIMPEDYIAQKAYEYLGSLLSALTAMYSKKELSSFVILQPENEPFFPFGSQKWRMSEAYLLEIIKRIYHFFPETSILLNSAETRNITQISKIFQKLKKEDKKRKLLCGIDYYYNFPRGIHLPGIGPLDYITFSNALLYKSHALNKRRARKLGFEIEVTEAQFERWGNQIFSPGNSAHEFKYLVARCVEQIIDPQKGGVIRLWGAERLGKRIIEHNLEKDHTEIIELIQSINKGK